MTCHKSSRDPILPTREAGRAPSGAREVGDFPHARGSPLWFGLHLQSSAAVRLFVSIWEEGSIAWRVRARRYLRPPRTICSFLDLIYSVPGSSPERVKHRLIGILRSIPNRLPASCFEQGMAAPSQEIYTLVHNEVRMVLRTRLYCRKPQSRRTLRGLHQG